MTLYIYNVETNEIVMTIEGNTNAECESKALEANYDQDVYGWTYTIEGLIR